MVDPFLVSEQEAAAMVLPCAVLGLLWQHPSCLFLSCLGMLHKHRRPSPLPPGRCLTDSSQFIACMTIGLVLAWLQAAVCRLGSVAYHFHLRCLKKDAVRSISFVLELYCYWSITTGGHCGSLSCLRPRAGPEHYAGSTRVSIGFDPPDN